MLEHAIPVLCALLLWWASTGAILYLDGLPRRTFRVSMAGVTLLMPAAVYELAASSAVTGAGAAYCGFVTAVLVWAWHEMAFLMGYVTGPRRHGCAPGCRGWRHFLHASSAVIHHELALVATLLAMGILTWGAPNQVAVQTFGLLWLLRLSAKLNLHLGVPNTGAALLPAHLAYLASFFREARMNPLFPCSVAAATLALALLVSAAAAQPPGSFEGTAHTLLATLLALGLLEHWLMVLPIRSTAIWGFGLRSRDTAASDLEPICRAARRRA